MPYKPKTKHVYNLEFGDHCMEMVIAGYRFTRVADYETKVKKLNQPVSISSEFTIKVNTGNHQITAIVELPDMEGETLFEWVEKSSPLEDILVLLSLFTARDVFAIDVGTEDKGSIVADPRRYQWGGLLRCSGQHAEETFEEFDFPCKRDISLPVRCNEIYALMKTQKWQSNYGRGFFLLLARNAFRRQILESAFLQCWTIWEHLFTLHNKEWLDRRDIENMSGKTKVAFLLTKYGLIEEATPDIHKKVQLLANIRNRLIHNGRFPEYAQAREDTELFIRLTEIIIARILELEPSNGFNSEERWAAFLSRPK